MRYPRLPLEFASIPLKGIVPPGMPHTSLTSPLLFEKMKCKQKTPSSNRSTIVWCCQPAAPAVPIFCCHLLCPKSTRNVAAATSVPKFCFCCCLISCVFVTCLWWHGAQVNWHNTNQIKQKGGKSDVYCCVLLSLSWLLVYLLHSGGSFMVCVVFACRALCRDCADHNKSIANCT